MPEDVFWLRPRIWFRGAVFSAVAFACLRSMIQSVWRGQLRECHFPLPAGLKRSESCKHLNANPHCISYPPKPTWIQMPYQKQRGQ